MRSAAVGFTLQTGVIAFGVCFTSHGFTPRQLEAEEACLLLDYGCGITSAVARPTVSATDLSRADYIAAQSCLSNAWFTGCTVPKYLAFLGNASKSSVFLNQCDISWRISANYIRRIRGVGLTQSERSQLCLCPLTMLADAYRELRRKQMSHLRRFVKARARRLSLCFHEALTNAAISSALVSSAKCPPSSR